MVLVEAIKQLLKKNPAALILAAAPSNSAADIIAERLISGPNALTNKQLFRMNAPNRGPDMPSVLEPFVLRSDGGFDVPHATTLKKFNVIVTTCASAYLLYKVQCPSDFTHVFVDEVGHACEPEGGI